MTSEPPPPLLHVDEETTLSKVAPEDTAELFALVDASRMYLRQWLPWVDATRGENDTLEFIARAQAQDRAGDGFQCTIRHRGNIVGILGFNHVNWVHRQAELGYWLAEEYQGRGIMSRACRALIGFGFAEWSLHRISILVASDNQKSLAIPERLGFTSEGTLRQSEWVNDRFFDTVVYGMLREEWEG